MKHPFPVAVLIVVAVASLGRAQDPAATGAQAPVASPAPSPAPSPSPTPQAPPPTPTGPRGPADPQGLTHLNLFGDSGQVTSGSAFNPSISVIPDVAYYNDNRDGAAGDLVSGADGFARHAAGGGLERGFNLREVEVAFSGAVDPYFDAWAILAIGDGEVEAEEVYVQTRRAAPRPAGARRQVLQRHRLPERKAPAPVGLRGRAAPVLAPPRRHAERGRAPGDLAAEASRLRPPRRRGCCRVTTRRSRNSWGRRRPRPSPRRPGRGCFTGFVKVSPNLGDVTRCRSVARSAGLALHQEFAEGQTGDEPLEGTGMVRRRRRRLPVRLAASRGASATSTLQGEYLYRGGRNSGRSTSPRTVPAAAARPHAGRVLRCRGCTASRRAGRPGCGSTPSA